MKIQRKWLPYIAIVVLLGIIAFKGDSKKTVQETVSPSAQTQTVGKVPELATKTDVKVLRSDGGKNPLYKIFMGLIGLVAVLAGTVLVILAIWLSWIKLFDKTNTKEDGKSKKESWLKKEQKAVLWAWVFLNILASLLATDLYWAILKSFWFWAGLQVFVITMAINWFSVGKTGEAGRNWIQRFSLTLIMIGTIFWILGVEIKNPEETVNGAGDKTGIKPAKILVSNELLGWREKEVNPSDLLTSADQWWQKHEQAKAAKKVAEAKAKEEASWKGSQTIIAPVTDDWSKAAEIRLPFSFNGGKLKVMNTETSGRWEAKYNVAGREKFYQGDELLDRIGPDLPRGGLVKFRSLEDEPLNILFRWR